MVSKPAGTIKAQIPAIKGDRHSVIDVMLIQPEIETRGMWGLVHKGRYSVIVYDRNGRFKEVVNLTVYPREPFGAWAVWGIKYRGKSYTSLVSDDIYPYLVIQEGQENRRRRNT